MTIATFFSPTLKPGWSLGVGNKIILGVANEVNARLLTTKEYIDTFREKDNSGAILHIAEGNDPERATSLLLAPFGFVPSDEREKYTDTTERNISQLLNYPNHISSYQSRDGITFWGGAYPIPKFQSYLSIFGHPELANEAIGLEIGLQLRWIDLNYAVQIAKISNNFLFTALFPRLPYFP